MALVTASWLKQELSSMSSKVKILDATWSATTSGYAKFVENHIPGARFFDLNRCVRPTPTLPRNMPEARCFIAYARSLGIHFDSHIVLYDQEKMIPSARAWWIFRVFGHKTVSVLNGGFNKWISEGNMLEEGDDDEEEPGQFRASLNTNILKHFESMREVAECKSAQIIDVRKPQHFSGAETEPAPASVKILEGMKQPLPRRMLRGHIPGAKNVPKKNFWNSAENQLQDKETLLKVFKDADVDLSQPMVTYCYGGNAASLVALAAAECGKDDVAVYYGSWTEWGQVAGPSLVEN